MVGRNVRYAAPRAARLAILAARGMFLGRCNGTSFEVAPAHKGIHSGDNYHSYISRRKQGFGGEGLGGRVYSSKTCDNARRVDGATAGF